ncbi:MAG: zinc ABC transporter substrate-binding protein [Phycisphaerae bacterium]|nr:zinc ABC transporter substrate-binding protein [Phycisphaerae bacterium]
MKAVTGTLTVAIAFLCLLSSGCGEGDAPAGGYSIAVTNSYLESVVRDLWGQDGGILCLAPPGMCPGHFDISPAQVRQLKDCSLLFRFDFQQGVEDRLARLREGGLDIQQIQPQGGLCVPDTYIASCRQVCQILSRAYPDRTGEFETRLAAVESRLAALAAQLRASVAQSGVAGAAVLCSNHQARFARWLGLDPIATFVGSDSETVANLDHCLRQTAGREVRFVIANRQEGTALAQALADRCRAKAVVFGNFPEDCRQGAGFDRLLQDNVRLLCEAVSR